ncbi:MAG: hypothetical protein ACNI28_02980 [Arcobacter sp.]|uniref:hypothetical protein n=1 Tax=Arcobacter sp. TaxID=1872629 RepID=UPI003AFFACA3
MLKNTLFLDSMFTKLFKVSEEILDKNIDEFILHKLKEDNNFKKNHHIFYSYIDLTKEYFICHYENKYNAITVIDIIIEFLKNKKLDNKRVAVYFKDYFLLFEHCKFYYFQKIEKELLREDIDEYIKKRFNFYVDESYHIDSSDLNNLINAKSYKSSLNYIGNRSAAKIYYLYLIALLLIGLFIYVYEYNNKRIIEKQKILSLEKQKKQNSIKRKDTLYYKTALLLNEIKENNLKIKKYVFSKKSLNVTIVSSKSDDAYAFLQKYKNIKVNSFIKSKDGYEISSKITF